MNMGDRRALALRVPLVATSSSTLPRLQLHLDDSTSLKGMVATANPMVAICAIEGTLVVLHRRILRFHGITDPILLCL